MGWNSNVSSRTIVKEWHRVGVEHIGVWICWPPLSGGASQEEAKGLAKQRNGRQTLAGSVNLSIIQRIPYQYFHFQLTVCKEETMPNK